MDIRPVDAERLAGSSESAQRKAAKQTAQSRLNEAVTQANQGQLNSELALEQQHEQMERAETQYMNSNLAASERLATPNDLDARLATASVASGMSHGPEFE